MDFLITLWSKIMAVVYMWKRRNTDRPGWEVEKKSPDKKELNIQLRLVRRWFTDNTTIGDLYIDGNKRFKILEDKFRDPNNDGIMQAHEKIPGETAIQQGIYQVIISFSTKFQRLMPLLLNVPHYTGIRMHSGVDHTHTAGCLITGVDKTEDNLQVTYGRKAYSDLFEILRVMCAHEKVLIEIVNEREDDESA